VHLSFPTSSHFNLSEFEFSFASARFWLVSLAVKLRFAQWIRGCAASGSSLCEGESLASLVVAAGTRSSREGFPFLGSKAAALRDHLSKNRAGLLKDALGLSFGIHLILADSLNISRRPQF